MSKALAARDLMWAVAWSSLSPSLLFSFGVRFLFHSLSADSCLVFGVFLLGGWGVEADSGPYKMYNFLCFSTREGTAGARNVGREENEERENGTGERNGGTLEGKKTRNVRMDRTNQHADTPRGRRILTSW